MSKRPYVSKDQHEKQNDSFSAASEWIFRKLDWTQNLSILKAGPLRLKQLTNTLKIGILSETSILYLIRYASIILTVGLRL